MSRRAFCAGGAAVLGLSACDPGLGRLSVGGLDGGPVAEGPGIDAAEPVDPGDMAGTPPHDLATTGTPPDLAQAMTNTCSGTVSGGAASAITASSPKYISSAHIYVCRDTSGLYAMSSECTHSGCKLTHQSTQFYCNCHGATFDLNGGSPTSPAHSALQHYALCVDGSGDVQVDTSQVVSSSTRA